MELARLELATSLVTAELVVAVLRNPPIAPWRRCGSRSSGRGSSGATVDRTDQPRPGDRGGQQHRTDTDRPRCESRLKATTNSITTTVKVAELTRFNRTDCSWSRSGATTRAIDTASAVASGR